MRQGFLRALVLFGVALAVSTESLGALHLIHRGPLILWWGVLLMCSCIALRRVRRPPRVHWDLFVTGCCAAIAIVLSLTATAALFSPPNSADAMAYHMPRVVYWAEMGSVRFFPTPYLNQIMLQPLAEYLMLHTYVLSGGDRFVNLVQWFGSLGSIIGVSAVAKVLGSGSRGQAMAAVFCATLPSGILASSGAKNDYFLAMWLVAGVYFALRFVKQENLPDALFFGAALGLALLTKATAYLFAPPLLIAIFVARPSRWDLRLRMGGAALSAALLINLPQYVRNYSLSGSPMGFDSAQGDGFFRWRNESFGWKQTASNVLRNWSDQIGARSARWNQGIYNVVVDAHRWLRADPNDPATTWRWSAYGPPKNTNHEADAGNRWHLALLFGIACLLAARAAKGCDLTRARYALGLLFGFVAFCAYLKWQPFMARLFLPLLVLSAPLAAVAGECRRVLIPALVCLFLLNNARPFLFENWVRPLRGPRSVLHTPRDSQYFADMTQWVNRVSYEQTISALAQSGCETIGIDIVKFQLEYPLIALVRERKPAALFVHTGVTNASNRYSPPIEAQPCAIVSLDQGKLSLTGAPR